MSQVSMDKLDAPTRAKLRSTQILTSLPQFVSELVQNSLDAGATLIDIGINCEEWMCWIKDNGHGISKQGFAALSKNSEEGRYGTSKDYTLGALNSVSTFGFRGEALASAAELACLEISSRTVSSRETWSIITKGGHNLYSGPAVRWQRQSPGTVVCIRDAFYNLPVRRLSHPPPARTLEIIRLDIETIALVFPHVTFTLDALDDKREAGASRGRSFRIPKTSSSLASFRNIYGRALTEHTADIDLVSGSLRLTGFISLNGAHSRSYQFLYVNRHPITRGELHKIIDGKFASSSFAKNALDQEGETNLPRSGVRRSPRKAEKKPVYVLNLTVPPEEVDNCLEPAKKNVLFRGNYVITTFLSTSIQSFLIGHGFLTRHNTTQPMYQEDMPSPRKRKKQDVEDSGYVESTGDLEFISDTELPPNYAQVPEEPLFPSTNKEVVWVDPNTAETFIVDTRTGNSRPFEQLPMSHSETEIDSSRQKRRTISFHPDNHREENSIPPWLQSALENNSTYKTTENLIPTLKVVSSTSHPNDPISHNCNEIMNLPGIVDPTSNSLPRRFGRIELQKAQVINQVDRKFIACLIEEQTTQVASDEDTYGSNRTGQALILIDQHAADERIRVERFLRELCRGFLYNSTDGSDSKSGVPTRELSPPKLLLLTVHEAKKLASSQDTQQAFHNWGFRFVDLSATQIPEEEIQDNDTPYAQVRVQTIPELVADKLLLGNELQDLIKGYLGQLEMGITLTQNPETVDRTNHDDLPWLKALRCCPRELLDLVNSKACRGAIMFNDTLSITRCQSLVKELSETVFPFQCAHGRPSLVPLTNIGGYHGQEKKRLPNWSRLELQ